MLENSHIPDKLYFRIGEVAKLIGVEPYVLRYWETEFPDIAPTKSQAKQRLYKRQDVELISKIRDLLYNQKFTIKGAKKRIKELKKDGKSKVDKQQITLGLETPQEIPLDSESFNDIKFVISEMNTYLKN